jgi:hypothetical protein
MILIEIVAGLFLAMILGEAIGWTINTLFNVAAWIVGPDPRDAPRQVKYTPKPPPSYEEKLRWSCSEFEIAEMKRRHPERFR